MAELDGHKEALIAQLRRARSRLEANGAELSEDLNVPAKIKASLSKHRGLWLGAAALFGLVLTQLPRRTKKVVINRKEKKEIEHAGVAALFFGVLKVALNVFKPLLVNWASKRVEAAVAAREAGRR